jgi:hypothetical protein
MDRTKRAQLHVLRLMADGWSLLSPNRSGQSAHLTSSLHAFAEVVLKERVVVGRLVHRQVDQVGGGRSEDGDGGQFRRCKVFKIAWRDFT